jgi:trk system potassium uptake protein TrkA
MVVGNGVDEEILKRAGIKEADAFAAVTNGDNRNIMASQIAKKIFNVKQVVCRIYDPRRQTTYEQLGLNSICPTLLGADLLFNALEGHKTRLVIDDEQPAVPTTPATARNTKISSK